MLTPNTSVVPPGGFHYIEKHDGIEVKIESSSTDAVIEALLRYRVNNNIPPGNPQADVYNFICGQWPHFCSNNNPYNKTVGRTPSPDEPLSRRAVVWITRLWNMGAGNQVTKEEAERRAKVCESCPNNSDYRAGGCGSCIEGIDRLAFNWLRQRSTPQDKQLNACKATGAILRCAVQAGQQPDLTEEEKAKLTPQCWQKVPQA
jgi:hypothetical protein